MKYLTVIANPKPVEEAKSKQLLDAFIKGLKTRVKTEDIKEIDLEKDKPPFYTYNTYKYFWYPVFVPGYKADAEEEKDVAYSKKHCASFNDADVLVLVFPMWNFSIPAILKAWIDQILMPGATFTMGADGIKPLHKIKKVVVLTSSGGTYEKGDPKDNITDLIKSEFGFVGITDFDVVWSEGQNPFFFTDADNRHKKALKEAEELGKKLA
jgi:FMN-dependent NADH-azoreductase